MKPSNLTDRKFNRLTARRSVGKDKNGKYLWECDCECGKTGVVVIGSLLVNGNTKSCGCWYDETRGQTNLDHGLSETPEYAAWLNMNSRCTKPGHSEWHNYGQRGISVCQDWIDDFRNFLRDVGERPSSDHSIDRIDNDGNYEPGNVRWATYSEQQNNKRASVKATVNGVTKTAAEWARETGFEEHVIRNRIKKKWPPERLFDPIVSPQESGRRAAIAKKKNIERKAIQPLFDLRALFYPESCDQDPVAEPGTVA